VSAGFDIDNMKLMQNHVNNDETDMLLHHK